ncbi:MAG: protein kinase [Byssovorax sp.]
MRQPHTPGTTDETLVADTGEVRAAAADHDSASLRGPSLIADRYEVEGLLGAGGMGRVYRVRDRALDEVVALKLLRHELGGDPAAKERFRNEVKLARRVTHPHVVRTYDFGEHGGESFLTMQYVEGEPLSRRLEREGALAVEEAVRLLIQVCEGVGAAHAAGVLHQDLKPDNVLVDAEGQASVTDFGIACALQAGGHHGPGLVGTPAYMAPEQVRGGAITAAADVYAIGALLFEAVTGQRIFPGDDPVAVAVARLHKSPPDPRSIRPVPDALARLILACLAVEPAGRPADAGVLGRALRTIDLTERIPRAAPAQLPAVPARSARAVAVLPLRCEAADLAELGEGLTEEIIDALSMTRGLRVRPLSSVRKVMTPGAEAREIGALLDVDVVVDATLRRVLGRMRLAGRAIGVADGFQLCAARVDCSPEGLLSAGDELARDMAKALTVELDAPAPAPAASALAIERYLVGKHILRTDWMLPEVARAIEPLDEARRLAPDHPGILAASSMVRSRAAFYGVDSGGGLSTARALAELAVANAPMLGETWVALATARLYDRAAPEAAFALIQALKRAPGLMEAQAQLGAIVLEAGRLADGIAHLEAAVAIDPLARQPRLDLARAYALTGRYPAAEAIIDGIDPDNPLWVFNKAFGRLRFAGWQGKPATVPEAWIARMNEPFRRICTALGPIYAERRIAPGDREVLYGVANAPNPRLRSASCQFAAEALAVGGDPEGALELLALAVDSGLGDLAWLDGCPLFDPLRRDPRFLAQRAVVAGRAAEVLAAVEEGFRATR